MLSFRNISAARRVGVEPRGSIAVPRTAGIGAEETVNAQTAMTVFHR
jgi:hypothetical protein